MGYLPRLTEGNTSRMMTETFYGYDKNLKAPDGTWCEEIGLSTRAFPLFAPRVQRGKVKIGDVKPVRMICKEKLVWVGTDRKLYYDNVPVKYTPVGFDEAQEVVLTDTPKQLVSMGAYLCVFPDGFYYNTMRENDAGYMYNKRESLSGGYKSIRMCNADGDNFDMTGTVISDIEPTEKKNGQYWIDSSASPHVLKKYSESQGQWVAMSTTYVKLSFPGIGAGFKDNDAVTISGLRNSGMSIEIERQLEALNGSKIIQKATESYIVIPGIIDESFGLTACSMTIERKVPKMDFVCELDNRLWGCHYGNEGGETVNTIYACAQGDPTNWFRYAGISTDSYAVNVGSDSAFTGMIAYGGYVLAFKERCVHKVYGTLPSNFSVTTSQLRGVANGSGDSLAIVNETLFYLSRNGVVKYDGSLPVSVFDAFGNDLYSDGRAGVLNGCYYICMKDGMLRDRVWVYDVDKGVWHHEDDTTFTQFVPVGSDLFGMDGNGDVWSMSGANGEKEGKVTFDAQSGIIGYAYPDHKYISRFVMRVKMSHDDELEVLTRYDSEGDWESQGVVHMSATNSFTLPVIPRRCDHMQIRLRGRGDIRIFSIAKVLEVGSDA